MPYHIKVFNFFGHNMATLVKEKRREKKKSKQKHASSREADLPSLVSDLSLECIESTTQHVKSDIKTSEELNTEIIEVKHDGESESKENSIDDSVKRDETEIETQMYNVTSTEKLSKLEVDHGSHLDNIEFKVTESENLTSDTYSSKENVKSNIVQSADDSKEISLEHTQNCSKIYGNLEEEVKNLEIEQDIMPSAPLLEQDHGIIPLSHPVIDYQVVETTKPKIQCMPLEEAIRVYGGREIVEVKAMSEVEEALVEGGPVSGPEHPLVDLLSSFRLSLNALERERAQISCNLIEEEKARSKLWKIEKRSINVSETCRCGATVDFKAVFDHAELLKEKLPAARMRLEAVLKDVQESYCHHQHAALLTYCQIEDLISETIESSKLCVREALSLVLQALRLSDGAADAYAHALRRWARALAAALVDERDLRQLLFLLHHLFRQTRSVRWASQIVRMSVTDSFSAARAIAVLDLLLARPGLETAVECTEEIEAWEEVDRCGGAGAVGEGRLRERDLCALLAAMPLHALCARLTLFARADIRTGSPLEWGDGSGGHGVVKCCAGVRTLLDVLTRAVRTHPAYTRLHDTLRSLACKLLHALAALHMHSSPLYTDELERRVGAELEACFVAGLALGARERLPAALLSPPAAVHYCTAFIVGLHDSAPRYIESLCVQAPVLSCDARVRVVAHAAADRSDDRDLARTVLEFLMQTGMKRKSSAGASAGACAGACVAAARESLARVLAAHRYLHTVAFEILADLYQAEPIDPSLVVWVCPGQWRPSAAQACGVLDDWARRCPSLLPTLLLLLDYTPHEGLSLETQLSVGGWLCGWVSERGGGGGGEEWCWAALRRLSVHRSQWGLPLDAPVPDEPKDMYATAYALLASAWGHCIPLACGPGAEALCRLAAARPAEAFHCLDSMMRLMAQSPESVSYTPKFSEALSTLLSGGPSLVQRALGRAGPAPAHTLQRLILTQLTDTRFPESPSSLLSAWLHALWKPCVPDAARSVLDAAVRAARLWPALDHYVEAVLEEENSKDYISDAMRNASAAPLLCEAMLRGLHAREVRSHTHPRLLDALWAQRANGQRIHVDNALKQIGAFMLSDELALHRAAGAVLAVPPAHPAHLTLWRLLLHIYLQRAPCSPQETAIPIGPLFFYGIVKSRVLSQLKKRLQDTAAYHQRQTEALKTSSSTEQPPHRPARRDKTSPEVDDTMFPSLSIVDLTGETADSCSEGEDDGLTVADEVEPARDSASNDTFNMICYHSAAEKMVREYLRWLEDGEAARAAPHHADIARFIPEQALDTAWRLSIPQLPETAESPAGAPPRRCEFNDTKLRQSHYERAVDVLLSVKDNSQRRRRRTSVRSLARGSVRDARSLLALVDTLLADIHTLAEEWCSEVRYISKLDSQLWALVGALRVRRPLPPVAKSCAHGCKPTTVRIPEDEWCISTGAERGIEENRRSARAALRRLARARPAAALAAATLHWAARRVRSVSEAARVAERAAGCAGGAGGCPLAEQALHTLVTELAERWLCTDGAACAALIRAWGGGAARQPLIGALVAPRRLRLDHYPPVYTALLAAPLPPHAAFSYLSKFELSQWAESAEVGQRRELLEALVAAAQATADRPTGQRQMLLELLGVHACAVVTSQELCALVVACARACASRRLPPAFLAAVARAANVHSAHVPFDKLGHLHRELGAVWWEARMATSSMTSYGQYAEPTARLLQALQRAFVAAARSISYEPAAVATFAWSSIQEAWGPWVAPHRAPPLLPSTGDREQYTGMLDAFVHTIGLVMELCPGSEESLLRQVWQWAVQTFLCVRGAGAAGAGPAGAGAGAGQEASVQLSALLAALAALQWHHQWVQLDCLQLALQAVSCGDKELSAWCGVTWRGAAPAAWLRGGADPAPALAALFALFTSPHAHLSTQKLLEACELPWGRLPAAALDDCLERFFIDHYSTALPYHDEPQFVIVLSASELRVPLGAPLSLSAASREKRARGVSRWTRAATAPALNAHVRAHVQHMLAVIAALAPSIERSVGELEDLLSRTIIMLCMEPAAAALPVWTQWVRTCSGRLRAACASAVTSVTSPEYFAPLAEAIAAAHLADRASGGWSELRARWSAGGAWLEGARLLAAGAPHAAYGALLARAHAARDLVAVLHHLEGLTRFDEAMTALWICVACRCAVRAGAAGAEGAAEEAGEVGARARALLARWGAEPRRSLLHAVLSAPAGPTPQHRLLCKLAHCITSPDEATAQAFEASCSTVLGPAAADVASWGRSAGPKRLPRLAARIYPDHEMYFREELELAPDTT